MLYFQPVSPVLIYELHKRTAMAQENETQTRKMNIRVRLDHKTIITIKDKAKLNFWKERYPQAVVLD